MISTLEEALERIKELEETNKQLLSELECYRQRNYGGRKKHNVTSPIMINLREEESNIWEMGRKLETCL